MHIAHLPCLIPHPGDDLEPVPLQEAVDCRPGLAAHRFGLDQHLVAGAVDLDQLRAQPRRSGAAGSRRSTASIQSNTTRLRVNTLPLKPVKT